MDTGRTHLMCAAALAAMVIVVTGGAQSAQSPAPLPARLDSYIKTYVKLTPEEQQRLLAGKPVTQLLESDPAKEVAIFGAVWVAAPITRYVEAVRNIEEFEKGDNFLVTKRISSPPRLEDFDRLSLPPDDVADLRKCKVGDCELKLGEAALVRIQKETDWSKPTATADVERGRGRPERADRPAGRRDRQSLHPRQGRGDRGDPRLPAVRLPHDALPDADPWRGQVGIDPRGIQRAQGSRDDEDGHDRDRKVPQGPAPGRSGQAHCEQRQEPVHHRPNDVQRVRQGLPTRGQDFT